MAHSLLIKSCVLRSINNIHNADNNEMTNIENKEKLAP